MNAVHRYVLFGRRSLDGAAERGRAQQVARHSGMTLLEVMLALALTAVVLAAISMAIDLHLRMLDSRRGTVERIQLARAVLQIIANDLRATVQQNSTDFSAVAAMAEGALAGGADLGALEDLAGGDGAGGDGAGGMGGSSDDLGGSSGGGAGDSMGGSAGGMSGDAGGMGADASTASEDIATSESVPPVPGLYGNQYELQIDVSRLPRVDEYQRMATSSLLNVVQDIPSDVKTVAYYCVNAGDTTSATALRDRSGQPQRGLVRRVLDRAVTMYASTTGGAGGLQQAADVIAPEVAAVEFEYFDGTEWLQQWDSEQEGGLPMAVKITLVLASIDATQSPADASMSRSTTAQIQPDQVYSLVVRLPTAKPIQLETGGDSSGMEAVGL